MALSEPAPDGSVHTGVGFYGKYIADGGSSNVHLSGFAIEGDVRERIDTDQVNGGIGGATRNPTIDGLYVRHTQVDLSFDGPMTNVKVTNSIWTRSPTRPTSTRASRTRWHRTTSCATPAAGRSAGGTVPLVRVVPANARP